MKASAQPTQAMTGQMLASAALAIPPLLWTGLPALSAWPWIVASTVLCMAAVTALLRGYEHGGFGVVYPMSRAASVLLVLPLAAAVAGEWPSMLGLVGVILVSAAVMMLALARGKTSAMTRTALLWTLAAAACTAGYTVSDARGVRQAQSAISYGCTLSIINGLLFTLLQRRSGLRLGALRAQWPRALPLALAATLSYWLILWVWTYAPIALASALRDTSAVFATVIALTVLKEPFDRNALLAVGLATAGAILIRLG
ncbi:MAG: EamA family transporter [Betaproteobacteria bacterium]